MPRSGAGVYTLPVGLPSNGDTSDADEDLRAPLEDVATDLNTPRPILAGGTGADNAIFARKNLGLNSFKDTATLLANTTLSYSGTSAVASGDIITTQLEGGVYQVASATATDHTLTTAGAIKLYERVARDGYETRADFVAANTAIAGLGLADGQVVTAGGYAYRRLAASTMISDLAGWVPNGEGTSPAHFGALPGVATDYTAQIQAAANAVKASWDAASWSFTRVLDFFDETFRADGSIDFSGVRQPRMAVRNGQLFSKAAGKIAFDCTLSNSVTFDDFLVWGDTSTPPAWGIYIGRGLSAGAYPGVDGVTFRGRSGAWGSFTRGAIFAFAAEVLSFDDNAVIENRNRSVSAVSLACVDHMGIISTQFGSETSSDFQTLPTAATGNHSNICHNWGKANFRRVADFNLTITAISKANPAVVTVSAGTLAGAGLSNGDKVYISGGDMTQVAYLAFTVANINTGADTFELSGINSTAYTTYTTGATLQNQTGPAILIGGVRTLSMAGSYVLTYGSPSFVINLDNGGAIYDWLVQFQAEREVDDQITFLRSSGAAVLPNINILTTQTSQNAKRSIFRISGAGQVELNSGSLVVSNMGTAPSDSVFSPQASFRARNFSIAVPLSAALPTPASMLAYSGTMTAFNRFPAPVQYGYGIEFPTSSTALTAAGLRWTGSALLAYRPTPAVERHVAINDSATTGQLASAADRVNTQDKYAGKMVWNATTARPVWASGGVSTSTWVDSTGAVLHTPV